MHKIIINSKTLDPQLSPQLLDNLGSNPVTIDGDAQKLALLASFINTIMQIGDLEHSSDWDPYLIIKLKNGTQIETESGHTEIIIGDFNDLEQFTALTHYQEITNIGFHLPNPKNTENPILTFYPIKNIKSIQITE